MRVLIVEDDYIIAAEAASHLREAGCVVVGMAASVKRALKLLDAASCDAAILDFNLGQETSEPIAAELVKRQVPFIVVSGYTDGQIGGSIGAAAHLTKPCRPETLVAAVLALGKPLKP